MTQTKKLEFRLMKNLATKKSTNSTSEAPVCDEGSKPCAKVKTAMSPNMAMRPSLRLTLELTLKRKGIVLNCETPLMIPLRIMLENSFCMRMAGP